MRAHSRSREPDVRTAETATPGETSDATATEAAAMESAPAVKATAETSGMTATALRPEWYGEENHKRRNGR